MRSWLLWFNLVSICIFVLNGCSSTTPPKPLSQQVETYPFREFKANVTVAANPCASYERVKESFPTGGEYLESNVLPVQLLVRNDGQDDLLFRIANVHLVSTDGTSRNGLNPAETYEAIKDSAGGGGYVALFGVFGVPAMLKQRERVMKDVMEASLKDTIISPRSAMTGFAFFPLQDSDTSLQGTKLRVVLQNPTALTETTFEIAMVGDFPKNRRTPPAKPTQP